MAHEGESSIVLGLGVFVRQRKNDGRAADFLNGYGASLAERTRWSGQLQFLEKEWLW